MYYILHHNHQIESEFFVGQPSTKKLILFRNKSIEELWEFNLVKNQITDNLVERGNWHIMGHMS